MNRGPTVGQLMSLNDGRQRAVKESYVLKFKNAEFEE